jgi:hypothetical protein
MAVAAALSEFQVSGFKLMTPHLLSVQALAGGADHSVPPAFSWIVPKLSLCYGC